MRVCVRQMLEEFDLPTGVRVRVYDSARVRGSSGEASGNGLGPPVTVVVDAGCALSWWGAGIEGARVIMYDVVRPAAGSGGGDAGDSGGGARSPEASARDLAGVLNALGVVDDDVILVSVGHRAAVSAVVAANNADRCARARAHFVPYYGDHVSMFACARVYLWLARGSAAYPHSPPRAASVVAS